MGKYPQAKKVAGPARRLPNRPNFHLYTEDVRILLGIDTGDAFPPAIPMILNLKFPDAELDLVHVIESVLPDGTFPQVGDSHPLSLMYKEKERVAAAALDLAASKFAEARVPARTLVKHGDAPLKLIQHADQEGCDLIVARTTSKGYFGSLFFGSVAKGLLNGAHQSLLIVKGEIQADKKLKVVFASDHSPYCDACVDLLAELAPQGIEHLIVLTVNELSDEVAKLMTEGIEDRKNLGANWVEEQLEARNQAICEKLAPLNSRFESRIVEGHTNKAIRKVMDETGADLLIMGAQGHGFFARLTLGSKSFHQVVSEPHSVLVLRPEFGS